MVSCNGCGKKLETWDAWFDRLPCVYCNGCADYLDGGET